LDVSVLCHGGVVGIHDLAKKDSASCSLNSTINSDHIALSAFVKENADIQNLQVRRLVL
jgi:hypothetical protein